MKESEAKALIMELEAGIIDPSRPNLIGGSNVRPGSLKGLPSSAAGSGFCSMAHWQSENDTFECRVAVEFGKHGAKVGYNFYNDNGELVYSEPFKAMRGVTTEGDIAIGVHHALREIINRLASHTERKIAKAMELGIDIKDVAISDVLISSVLEEVLVPIEKEII